MTCKELFTPTLAVMALFTGVAPAYSQSEPEQLAAQQVYKQGKWSVTRLGNGCFLGNHDETTGTALTLAKSNFDGPHAVMLIGEQGPAILGNPSASFAINGELTPAEFSGGSTKLFIASDLSKAFETSFRVGQTLDLRVDGQAIVSFSLTGSAAAYRQLELCADGLPKVPPDRPSVYIPPPEPVIAEPDLEGPFPPDREAQPITPGSWVTARDFPNRTLREERDGTVRFRVQVGVNGRVKACNVTGSSGHFDLDKQTCELVTRRARFEPATDSEGALTEGSWASAVRWQIPG